jgi:monomeric isocitrate dehydrogenase
MKHLGLLRFPSADRRSLRWGGRREDEAEGHFADWPHHRQLPDKLTPAQKINNELADLANLRCAPSQHHQAAQHLRLDPAAEGCDQRLGKGYDVPNYPDTTRRQWIRKTAPATARCSAAPSIVLREGINSDRRAAGAIEAVRAQQSA